VGAQTVKPQAETEVREPGRPPLDEKGSSVSTWLPASQHDRLIRLANERDQSVSALVRQLLARKLR
jgi:hypothetical protein